MIKRPPKTEHVAEKDTTQAQPVTMRHRFTDDATRNLLARASAKHLPRRFSGAQLTGFGGLQ